MSFPTLPGTGGLPKVLLSSRDGARAEIYLHGAHLTSWVPAGSSADRLFLSARSRFSDGAVAEIFLTNGRIDSHADAMARDAAVAASLALQHGTSLETLRRALLRDPHGVASGPLGTALDLVAGNRGAAS